MPNTHPDAKPAIHVESLNYSYTPGRASFNLTIPSLKIDLGEKVALVGPSGSGKTTLLGLICGVLRPQAGCLNVLGNDLGAMSTRKRDQFRAENLGIIFQQFNLLPYLSVTENVVLALQFSQHRKLKMADKLKRAHKMLTALDMPPESMGKMPVADLSVGQQQRVAAARAFVGEAPIIIADEPTSSLDEGRQQEFLDLLFQQADQRGATLLLVTHDQRVASKFDRVLDLRDVCHVTTTAETQ